MRCSRAEPHLNGATRSGLMAVRRQPLRRVSMLCGLLAAAAFSMSAAAVQDTSANRIGADLWFLADDLLEGRSSQSKGYDIAAHYVAAQMRSIGLRPGAGDGAWLQPVPMLEARAVARNARLVIRHQETRLALKPLIDFIPEPSFLTDRVKVNATMVFAGFGISAPEFGYDSFRDVDVNGKVVVFLDGMPAAIPAPLHVFFKKQRARQLSERGLLEEAHAGGRAGRAPLLCPGGRQALDGRPGGRVFRFVGATVGATFRRVVGNGLICR